MLELGKNINDGSVFFHGHDPGIVQLLWTLAVLLYSDKIKPIYLSIVAEQLLISSVSPELFLPTLSQQESERTQMQSCTQEQPIEFIGKNNNIKAYSKGAKVKQKDPENKGKSKRIQAL